MLEIFTELSTIKILILTIVAMFLLSKSIDILKDFFFKHFSRRTEFDSDTEFESGKNEVFISANSSWMIYGYLSDVGPSILLDEAKLNLLCRYFQIFKENTDTLSVMIEGPTGVGKLGLVCYAAKQVGLGVHVMSIDDLLSGNSLKLISLIPINSLLVIKGIDQIGTCSDHRGKQIPKGTYSSALAAILTILDSTLMLRGICVIVTCSEWSKLNKELRHPDMYNVRIQLDKISAKRVEKYLRGLYPDIPVEYQNFQPMTSISLKQLTRKIDVEGLSVLK